MSCTLEKQGKRANSGTNKKNTNDFIATRLLSTIDKMRDFFIATRFYQPLIRLTFLYRYASLFCCHAALIDQSECRPSWSAGANQRAGYTCCYCPDVFIQHPNHSAIIGIFFQKELFSLQLISCGESLYLIEDKKVFIFYFY